MPSRTNRTRPSSPRFPHSSPGRRPRGSAGRGNGRSDHSPPSSARRSWPWPRPSAPRPGACPTGGPVWRGRNGLPPGCPRQSSASWRRGQRSAAASPRYRAPTCLPRHPVPQSAFRQSHVRPCPQRIRFREAEIWAPKLCPGFRAGPARRITRTGEPSSRRLSPMRNPQQNPGPPATPSRVRGTHRAAPAKHRAVRRTPAARGTPRRRWRSS